MKYESSHFGKQIATNEKLSIEGNYWDKVMPIPEEDIEYDDDCPAPESGMYINGVCRINGRIIPPRRSPADKHDPELLAFMKSITPLVQMEPDILGGMPVFKGTLVPIKRMFDYLLSGKSMDEFLDGHPSVSRDTATGVLHSDATLFYEAISKAKDSVEFP